VFSPLLIHRGAEQGRRIDDLQQLMSKLIHESNHILQERWVQKYVFEEQCWKQHQDKFFSLLLSFLKGKSIHMASPCCLLVWVCLLWTYKSIGQLSWNFVWALCHWKSPNPMLFNFLHSGMRIWRMQNNWQLIHGF
jgi:hypothetical protein